MHLIPKLEIDIMQANELAEAMEFACVYRTQAVVVHPDLAAEAAIQRTRRQARCKIITPVDWPKGEKFGVSKMHTMPLAALSQDGFEIMLSPRDINKLKAELLELSNFVREHLLNATEIRFVLGALTYDQKDVLKLCEALKSIPAPTLLRTDTNLRIQQIKANATSHSEMIESIKHIISRPLKLSGNISTVKMLTSCKAERYAVSLKQAQAIVKEIRDNPEKVEKLIAAASPKVEA